MQIYKSHANLQNCECVWIATLRLAMTMDEVISEQC